MDEGLAVVFENGDLRWAEKMVGKAPSLIPLPQLHNGFLILPEDQIPLAYAESALAVRMLMDRSGALTLTMLLKDLDAGQDFATAFDHHFTFSYLEFQRVWYEPLKASSGQ